MTIANPSALDAIGARAIPEFDGVHDVWPRGRRLAAVREAATAYKTRFKSQGQIHAVRSIDVATAPYPTGFAFHFAAIAPHVPMISLMNRMTVVEYDDFAGERRILVFEPTVTAGSAEAPFYRSLLELGEKVPLGLGPRLTEAVYLKYHNEPQDALRQLGLTPDDIDYATFDHLHVQDPRMILGSSTVIPGETTPRTAIFGDAKLLAHTREVATFDALHPMQWAWYVEDGMDGVDPGSILTFDGDIELGVGVTLVWTPGHTDGNHSLVVNTPDGVWVSSENGISADNWQPELSKIPGVKRYSKHYGREIVPNANTLEDSLDQYDSMVKEKILADPCTADPRWLQIQPSSELLAWKRFWPVVPGITHGGLNYGQLSRRHV
jgi:hypothetical protein